MPNADDLRLNSISRFSKRSPRLTLEVHSHCEVPAGCGGVVLRWYNPATGLPVLFTAYFTVAARVLVNGAALPSSRPLLPLGPVVIGMEIEHAFPHRGLFILAGTRSEGFSAESDSLTVFRSLPDGSWRYSLSSPPEGWLLQGFDAEAWPSLVERPTEEPSKDDYQRAHAYARLRSLGARPLGLSPNPKETDAGRGSLLAGRLPRIRSALGPVFPLWIRTEFHNGMEPEA